MFHWILTAFAIAVIFACEQIRPVGRKWLQTTAVKLPPGPRGIPLLGNLIQFQRARSAGFLGSYLLSLAQYGELATVHMGSHLWVFINTDQAAIDLIDKKALITSERPHMPIASGLVSHGKRSVLQRTSVWKEGRRLMRALLSSSSTKSFTDWQDLESIQLLVSYVETPRLWYLHQARWGTAFLYGVVTGDRLFKTHEELEEYRQITYQFLGSFYASMVDFFPVLGQLPTSLQIWRPQWEALGRSHRDMFRKWWEPIKTRTKEKTAKSSWVRDVVLNPGTKFNGGDEDAMFLTNSVISAGGDNSRMVLNTFVMASICYPEQFRLCRQEIDRVCGSNSGRLPVLEDVSSMPYVCGFIKEVLRWRPIVPMVPPHQLTEELAYHGYVFPKGTNFVINTVAICSDCDDPDEIDPSRWLDGHESDLTRGFWGFGGGRRVCIGYKAAQPALFLAISRLIYCFDFKAGGLIDSRKLNHTSSKEPFPAVVTVRNATVESLINKESRARGLRS